MNSICYLVCWFILGLNVLFIPIRTVGMFFCHCGGHVFVTLDKCCRTICVLAHISMMLFEMYMGCL